MPEFVTVCRLEELIEGQGRAFEVAGKLIAIFLHAGQCFAIDDVCPHMGASLSEGELANGIVTCPWHAWRFRLADGAWADSPRVRIGCFPVRVENGQVQVLVGSNGA
jgi:nitrite reductase (NADH) small subunit/3-phenylpropionate/trans-cinnamate dioxygenase ferredoxin subunit